MFLLTSHKPHVSIKVKGVQRPFQSTSATKGDYCTLLSVGPLGPQNVTSCVRIYCRTTDLIRFREVETFAVPRQTEQFVITNICDYKCTMVQRQRADPGGARGGIRTGSGAGQDPEANVARVKSSEESHSMSEIVVDAIDTRQVVDEIRDNNSACAEDRQRDGSTVEGLIDLTKRHEQETKQQVGEVPRASWFDVFDWTNLGYSMENDTNEQKEEVKEDALDKPTAPCQEVTAVSIERQTRPTVVKDTVEFGGPVVPTEDFAASKVETYEARSPRAIMERVELGHAVVPSSDFMVSNFERATARSPRAVVKERVELGKTVVSGRDLAVSNFERTTARSPRAAVKERVALGKAVIPIKDQAASDVEHTARPTVIPLSKIFQREPNAPVRELVSEEFTSNSVISASELKSKAFQRTAAMPKLFSEEFTAASIVSASELQSMHFTPTTIPTSMVDTTPLVDLMKSENPIASPASVEVTETLPTVINPAKSSEGEDATPTVQSEQKLESEAMMENQVEETPMAAAEISATAMPAQTSELFNCLCFETDAATNDEKNASNDLLEDQSKPSTGTLAMQKIALTRQRSMLSTIFACIDPAPTFGADTELLDEIEKTLAAEISREVEARTSLVVDTTAEEFIAEGAPNETKTAVAPISLLGSSPTATKPVTPTSLPRPSQTLSYTPVESNMIYNEVKDNESLDGNLFDNDLESVPSATEHVKDSVQPMQPEEQGSTTRRRSYTVALAESTIKHLKLPAEQMAANLEEASMASTRTGISSKEKFDPSVNARRRLLIKELRLAISTFGRYDIRCANISAALGDLLDEAQEYDHALKLHKDAITIYSCKLGDDHTTTMDAKLRLGAVLENAGQMEEAINNYYQVTVMRRALRGDHDPTVADGLVYMAHALRKKGDYVQAIKELKRALKVFRESLGDSHGKVAATVDEIASLYVTIGDFDKAAAILEEVVKLKAATIGMKSTAVASTLVHLATAYECSEKFAEAMKALKKSYKIYTEIGGYSSEDATATLNRMAQLYEATNDHNRAAVAYLGVLRGRKIQRGADHVLVGETYFRLGHSLRETKQYDKSMKCLKEALPIFVGQGVEMNDVKMVAEIMHEMAMINQDRGHFQDAARIFKQELSVRRKIGQPEFPFAARTLKHLGAIEYQMKNYNRALKYLVEALTIYQDRGDQGVDCGEVLFHTGLVFQKVNNKDRALEAFVEAVRIFSDHNLPEDFPMLREANEKIEMIDQGLKEPRRFPLLSKRS